MCKRIKIVSILIASVLLFNLGGHIAQADGMILPEVLSPDYLVVRYHHVTVTIEDNHAVTRVEQMFYNPHSFPVSGQYLFPVPPEAILSRFEATVDGQRQTMARQDPSATNAALYDIVAQRRDPSLLQYADWESLALDLDLPAGGSREMTLEYEQVLAPSGGLYRYRYVLSTERYSAQPLKDVSLTVDLHTASGLSSLYAASHAVTTERLGPGRARVTWEAQDVRPTEDFELFFAPTKGGFAPAKGGFAPAKGGFGGGLLTGQREGQDHFMFLFAPETTAIRDDALPKDIVFVIDRSGSMSGEKIEQAHNALHFILGQLDESDRFSIVGFDHRLSILSRTLQPVTKESLANARGFVDGLSADGNTDLEAALQAGLEILDSSERRDASQMVVFLTDGLPTAGVTDEALIARLVTRINGPIEARLHVFGVGYDVNTHLLDRLAADNGGSVTYVQPGENLEAALTGFYARIAHPVLTDVEIELEGLEASHLYPRQIPDMFQGSSLLLTGRYRATASEATVRVRGRAGDEAREYVYHFDLQQLENHDFVPRLWATRRVGELLDRVRVEGESEALVAEIRELGLGYGLVTPYTTFAIQAQADGAASAANMALYDDQAGLNQAWGQTTIQARVQNQLYQQAAQANLANGANVINQGQFSLAQVPGQNQNQNQNQNIDLALLKGQDDLDEPVTLDWIARNVGIDLDVAFGSEAYFALADDPAIRPFLQSGPNVVFAYRGQVISVQDLEAPARDDQASDLQNPVPSPDTYQEQNLSVTNQPFSPWLRDWWEVFVEILERWIRL